MSVEEKLEEVIEILLRIEAKLGSESQQKVEEGILDVQDLKNPEKPFKPSKSQLKFQFQVKVDGRLRRTNFLKAIRSEAHNLMVQREQGEDIDLSFSPPMLNEIEVKIAKTGAQFYKDLKDFSIRYAKGVEFEGEKCLQRAIGRLKARA